MIPSWEDAPDWAEYRSMDKNGKWCWFQSAPRKTSQGDWQPTGGRWQEAEPNENAWEESLERRP